MSHVEFGTNCTPCAAGKFQNGDPSQLHHCRVCNNGQFQPAVGSVTCSTCPAGYHRSNDDQACTGKKGHVMVGCNPQAHECVPCGAGEERMQL